MSKRVTARAPGRVNLIGDHTDYQDGFCLPMSIDREVAVDAVAREDGRVRVVSSAVRGTVDVPAAGAAALDDVEPAWGRTVAAVLQVLAARGRPPVGFDANVRSTVPVGSGLSSSAAFEVALALAATAIAGTHLDATEVARLAQESEHLATGVPCGVMDQMAVVHGRAGHGLLLDCRTLDVTPVALPRDAAVLVVHSGLGRRLEASEYAQRRRACEQVAADLGVATLRDASPAQVAGIPIARHVVSENERVLAFVDALRRSDLDRAGRLMLASHTSLRDDFRVSTPELDLLVDLAVGHGALGARLTGAGFGGCIVALADAATGEAIADAVAAEYVAATGLTPTAFLVRAVDGAGPIGPAPRAEE
jgi:galactokinase